MVEMIAGLNRRQQRKPRRTDGSGFCRVAFLPGDTLAEYGFLGLGRIVQEIYPEPEVRLDYDSGTPGDYAGFDRFDRVVDHLWYAYAASADRDCYTYGYDRASNRLYRENTLTSGRDEPGAADGDVHGPRFGRDYGRAILCTCVRNSSKASHRNRLRKWLTSSVAATR